VFYNPPFTNFVSGSDKDVTIQAVSYSKDKGRIKDDQPTFSDSSLYLASRIISVNFVDKDGKPIKVANLGKQNAIKFLVKTEGAVHPSTKCKWWNEEAQRWDSDGCQTVLHDNGKAECQTQHLTGTEFFWLHSRVHTQSHHDTTPRNATRFRPDFQPWPRLSVFWEPPLHSFRLVAPGFIHLLRAPVLHTLETIGVPPLQFWLLRAPGSALLSTHPSLPQFSPPCQKCQYYLVTTQFVLLALFSLSRYVAGGQRL
jgi:hypothetical protein